MISTDIDYLDTRENEANLDNLKNDNIFLNFNL